MIVVEAEPFLAALTPGTETYKHPTREAPKPRASNWRSGRW